MFKKRRNVIKQKQVLRNFIDYLLDSYYLNPNTILDYEIIIKKLKIKNDLIIKEFFINLNKNKLIKSDNKKSNKFVINYNGFLYLEEKQDISKRYENNLITIILSIGTIFISFFNLSLIVGDKSFISFIIIVVSIIIGFVLKSVEEVLLKKYY